MTGGIIKKVSELDKNIDNVNLIKLMEGYKESYPITVILDWVGGKKATYYHWKNDLKPSQEKEQILQKAEQLCLEHHVIYGYRMMTCLLKKHWGLLVNHKKVYRIMKQKRWLCRVKPRKSPRFGKPHHVTNNKSKRDFKADKPLQKLVTDITYLYFGQCKLYLSSLMDLYNQKIVADTISETQDTDVVLNTLNQLDLAPGTLLHNIENGVHK